MAKKKAASKDESDQPTRLTSKRAKQNHLPGMKPKRDAAVEKLGEELDEARRERLEWQQRELSAEKRLAELLAKKEIEKYESPDPDGIIVLASVPDPEKMKTKVKIRHKTDEQ